MANWRPVFVELLREGRKVYAVKLLAEAGTLELKAAADWVDGIGRMTHKLPRPSEFPNIPGERLAYYKSAPYRLTMDPGRRGVTQTGQEITQHHGRPWEYDVHAQLTRGHHRLLARLNTIGVLTLEAQHGTTPEGTLIHQGQRDYRMATELVRNGLADELRQHSGQHGLVHFSVITIGVAT